MAGQGDTHLFHIHFDLGDKDEERAIPAPVLIESIAGFQRVVFLLAKFTLGEELGQRATFSRSLKDTFSLHCHAAEPGSYAVPFRIGMNEETTLTASVTKLFQRVTEALGAGDVHAVRELMAEPRYLLGVVDAFRKAQPPPRHGISYWIEDHHRHRILDSRRVERTLDDLRAGAHETTCVEDDTASGMLVGMDFDKRRIRLTRPDGKSFSVSYDDESERPLIDNRRGWIQVTGDVRYDASGHPLSVTRARDILPLGDDAIELRALNLYNVSYRAEPPLQFHVTFHSQKGIYELDGDFGISVSAYSPPELHQELHEALSMLWIEYGEESPSRLSPKARKLRKSLRDRIRRV